ncbi:MAG: zinc-dependent alcohol dehydrogenase family protein [Gordonia paraffinivorans]
MRAVQLNAYGPPGPDTVVLVDVPTPTPGPGQVAVAVDLSPINPSDLLLIAGHYGYRPPLPTILGAEAVGHVVAVGDDVGRDRLGEQVVIRPTLVDATWREQMVVDDHDAIAVEGDTAQLAMLGINPMTAWAMLFGVVDLPAGARVIQTGANSATAGMVRALARRAGVRLIDIARRPESAAALRDSGAQVVVDGPDVVRRVREILGSDRADLIIDGVGGETTTALAGCLSTGGSVISYTSRSGNPVTVGIADLVFRGLTVHGFWLRNWQASQPADEVTRRYRELAELVADGTLWSPIEATYPLDDIGDALTHAARRDRRGKILLAPNGVRA